MADPGTWAFLIGAAATAIGTGYQLYSSAQQARHARAAGRYGEAVAAQQAAIARAAGEAEGERRRELARAVSAQQRAATGAAGVTQEGSPLLVMMDTVAEGELAALRAQYGGELQARAAESEGRLARFQAEGVRHRATVGAGASLLAGAADIGRQYFLWRRRRGGFDTQIP